MLFWSYFRGDAKRQLILSSSLVFLLALLGLGLVHQLPFTYAVNLGQSSDEWAVVRGFGDREQNENFSFRWTTQAQAELRLPDVGWPSRVGLVGLAPRPDGKAPTASLTSDRNFSFVFGPASASQPPASDGRLTFEVAGPEPEFQLTPNRLLIGSDLYDPPGDPRSLGLVVNQVYLKPQPNRFGLVVPPLTPWLGFALALALLYFNLSRTQLRQAGPKVRYRWWPFLVTGGGLLVVMAGRWLFPEWIAVNGASVAWGVALPLIAWVVTVRWRAVALFGQLLIGVSLVFYGQALAPFALALCCATGLLFLALALPQNFASHLENAGLLTCLTAPIGWLLWQSQLPRAVDLITYHLPWLNELDYIVRQGNLYPRWSPDFVWQQGWPIFNYYPPGSRYFSLLLHFAGLSFNNAVLMAEYIALLVATIGSYFWCQEILKDRRAALLGALAFCYLPYRLVDLVSSGTLANFLGGALLPWLVWLLTLLVRRPQNKLYPLWLGLLGAALAVTSTPQLLVFLPIIILYMVGLVLIEGQAGNLDWRRSGLGLVGAAALAFGLSAFYLLPATLELNQVTLKFARASLEDSSRLWANVSSPFDFWHPIFVSLGMVNSFATLHFWLAGAGLLVLIFARPQLRPYLVLLALVTTWAVVLQLPVSRFFWQTFPELTSVQFSSRLLYSATIFAGPLIGGLFLGFKKSQWQNWASALTGIVAVGLMLYACFYNLVCPYWPVSFDGTISRRSLIEQIGNADSMYLPKGAEQSEITQYSKPAFADGRAFSATDDLKWEITGPDNYRLTAKLSQPGIVSVPLFWFDGWWKATDGSGHDYQSSPTPRTRHLQLQLPAGEQQITVKLQDTFVRQIGNGLTLLALLGLAGYIIWRLWQKKSYIASTGRPEKIRN